jgi:hypothetical protein
LYAIQFCKNYPIDHSFYLGNVDRAGPGSIFVMVYSQVNENSFQPIVIPIQIQPRPSNHIRISLSPSKIGTYRIYIAYRNIPVNGRLSLLSITLDLKKSFTIK